jgi:hypothetical protein
VDQVQLKTGRDLVNIGELDQKLWVALACPVNGSEFDKRTLELIDNDGDKRVRAGELIAAAQWVASVLNDVELLATHGDSVPLSAIDGTKLEGQRLLATAKRLLANIGKSNTGELSFADLQAGLGKFDKEKFNGDGIVTPGTASDAATAALITDMLACTATHATDRSGDPGLTREMVAAFFAAVADHVSWLEAGKADGILPLGEATASAYAAFDAVRAKVDDYFSRVKVATYDARALDAINREQAEYLAIAAKDLHISSEEVKHFPLARIAGEQPLPLDKGLNPAWMDAMVAFRESVVVPLVGAKATALTHDQWKEIRAKFAAHAEWLGKKAGVAVEKLGAARLADVMKPEFKAAVEALFDEEDAAKPLADALKDTERLVRYRRDLMELAHNFVNFRNFYSRRAPAMFQVGRLYMDRRTTDLCIAVNDAARHGTMAPMSGFYILYCELRNAKGETKSIAAAVTDGDVDNLMVGRNGIFYDRAGQDWDATITKIIENPISVRQAFWTPYKKLLRLIEEQMTKRAQAADAAADAKIGETAAKTDAAASGVVPPPTAPKKLDIGVVAAIGVAVGGIAAAFGALLQAFFGLGFWMPLGFLGLMLAISGPSMAIAWLKLRKRNLGPLLDANGWALGSMAKVNIKLGKSLTALAELPKGAERDLVDPFADKKKPWWLYSILTFILVFGVLWFVGKVDGCLPDSVKSTTVLGKDAPAAIIEEKNKPAEPEPAGGADPAPAPAPAP